VVWQNENLDDLVLLRGDGNPTYMLAVGGRHHDMGVTHVIRGDDHLIKAARQSRSTTRSMGPSQHVPHSLIMAPTVKALKTPRRLGVDAYRAMGYLPAALRNYLVRLGEPRRPGIFSTEEMIDAFDLSG